MKAVLNSCPRRGLRFPADVLEEALTKYQDKINDNLAIGGLDDWNGDAKLASHIVTGVEQYGEDYKVHIETLDTPLGRLLADAIKDDAPALCGNLSGGGHAVDKVVQPGFELFSINVGVFF